MIGISEVNSMFLCVCVCVCVGGGDETVRIFMEITCTGLFSLFFLRGGGGAVGGKEF